MKILLILYEVYDDSLCGPVFSGLKKNPRLEFRVFEIFK